MYDTKQLETLDYKPTIEELEKMIGTPNEIEIMPNGQIRRKVYLAEQSPVNCACLGKPTIHTIECVTNPKPTNSPPETLGMNSHVIRPEMKVNKVKDVGQTPIKTGVAIPESEADKLLYETLGPTCKTCGRVLE